MIETWGELITAQGLIVFKHDVSDEEKRKLMKAHVEGPVTRFHDLCERQLTMLRSRFLAGNHVTIVDFVMCSYVANVIFNENAPFSAVTQAILGKTPYFMNYCDIVM